MPGEERWRAREVEANAERVHLRARDGSREMLYGSEMVATSTDTIGAGAAPRSRRQLAWLVLLALLVPPLLKGALLVRHAIKTLFPYRSHVTQAQAEDARRRLPALEDVSFPTKDGLVLRGWFAPGKNRDAVVFVHGLTANRVAFLGEGEALSRHGHGVLLYDSRASGESDGRLATFGDRERLDVEGALDFLSGRPDVDRGKLGLFGCSVGGTAVALVGAEDPRARAVLLGPTWLSLDAELHTNGGRYAGVILALYRLAGVDVDALRPVDVVRSIAPRPLLMISGALDDDTPPPIMEALQAAAPGSDRWVVPGAGHCRYIEVSPVDYLRRLDDFFDRSLGAGG
jgi:dipeptidyl aminopeptidase/acylaminoacyl peptidase